MTKRVLIVGGVAGGATCAARLRRLDESARIVIFDRGPFVSFANCGLPYYVGNVIPDEQQLLQATPATFAEQFNIEVRTGQEVLRIDRAARQIEVRDVASGRTYSESYDALVLSPGAAPIRPQLPGIDLPGIHVLRSIPDSREIRAWIDAHHPSRAIVVGGGFIGLEMAENFVLRGLAVTIVEKLPQLMPVLDAEMAEPLARHLEKQRVNLQLGEGIAGFAPGARGGLEVLTEGGISLEADLVILAVGVRPETGLAREAGLDTGPCGGIRVDQSMRTSDPHIWAVGDAVETRDAVLDAPRLAMLAGPAQRQGRIAAASICGRPASFRGSQGTLVCGCLGITVAMTGASEKALRAAGRSGFQAIYLHPFSHASYYPGAKPIALKLIFQASDGRVLGAQAVGEEGVEKRIDVISMAIQRQATVFDLEEAELCYAPQFGSAKDPVNLAGMIAANVLRGDVPLASWQDLERGEAFIVDVRDPHEFAAGHIDGALNIPLSQFRRRLEELPRDREIWLYCGKGQRSYYATRVLVQRGFAARNLPGGYQTFWSVYP